MGCFGGNSDGFGCEWLIILAILFFCFCNNGSNDFLSDLFDDCTVIWIAIILLLLYICCSDNCDEDC